MNLKLEQVNSETDLQNFEIQAGLFDDDRPQRRTTQSTTTTTALKPDEQHHDEKNVSPLMRAVLNVPPSFCPGCGIRFQPTESQAPGYIPAEKLEQLSMKSSRSHVDNVDGVKSLNARPKRELICQRCHSLRFKNSLPSDSLRIGGARTVSNADQDQLSPHHFLDLISSLSQKECILVCLVDIFDFHGSLVPNLGSIVGRNSPLMLVVNKVDLLPHDVRTADVERWVRWEARQANLPPIDSIDVISCKTGQGLPQLLGRLEKKMVSLNLDAYVLGAANAGKSSFINSILKSSNTRRVVGGRTLSRPASHSSPLDGFLTTSQMPGTTLGFVKAAVLGGKRALYDTPGLILPNQLTTLLTTDEVTSVVPKKRPTHVSLRLSDDKVVLIGGLGRVRILEGRPFIFTFYFANDVVIHPTDVHRADSIVQKHIGGMIAPPSSGERLAELGVLKEQSIHVTGRGWDEVGIDIVLPGLGWVAVTGSGSCTVQVSLPDPIIAFTREPLLAQDNWRKTSVKSSGGKLVNSRGHQRRRRR